MDAISILGDGILECGATESCKDSYIQNSAMWIDTDCTGNRACYGSNIVSSWGVMCDAHYSCSKSEIMSYQDIECNGKGSCHNARMNATKYSGTSKVNIGGHYGAANA